MRPICLRLVKPEILMSSSCSWSRISVISTDREVLLKKFEAVGSKYSNLNRNLFLWDTTSENWNMFFVCTKRHLYVQSSEQCAINQPTLYHLMSTMVKLTINKPASKLSSFGNKKRIHFSKNPESCLHSFRCPTTTRSSFDERKITTDKLQEFPFKVGLNQYSK